MTQDEVAPSRGLAAAKARGAARRWIDRYLPAGRLYPAVCTQCQATHWEGRWRWDDAPPDLVPVICPACQRIMEGCAAHVVVLSGDLLPHWPEVKDILGHVERAELEERPMERVMKIEVGADRVLVSTTGMHVARRITAALARRWHQQVRVSFEDAVTRIQWIGQAEEAPSAAAADTECAGPLSAPARARVQEPLVPPPQ